MNLEHKTDLFVILSGIEPIVIQQNTSASFQRESIFGSRGWGIPTACKPAAGWTHMRPRKPSRRRRFNAVVPRYETLYSRAAGVLWGLFTKMRKPRSHTREVWSSNPSGCVSNCCHTIFQCTFWWNSFLRIWRKLQSDSRVTLRVTVSKFGYLMRAFTPTDLRKTDHRGEGN